MRLKYRLTSYIISISFFIFGIIIIHTIHNKIYLQNFTFFGIFINRELIFDIGLLLIGLSFFILFVMTFKPINILES